VGEVREPGKHADDQPDPDGERTDDAPHADASSWAVARPRVRLGTDAVAFPACGPGRRLSVIQPRGREREPVGSEGRPSQASTLLLGEGDDETASAVSSVLAEVAPLHGGRVVEVAGAAVGAEFGSVDGAVGAAA